MCIMALGAIAGVAGGVLSAAGSLYSGSVQAAQYKAEARMHQYEADSAREAGVLDVWRKDRENERLTGEQIVAVAAGGGDLSGSNLDLVKESRMEGDLDKALIRANAQQRSDMSMYKSKVAKVNAKSAKTASLFSAGAGLINSFQSLGSLA